MMHRFFLWTSRMGFAALILFELANFAGILSFTLEFSWFGLVATAVPVWIALEAGHAYFRRRHAWHFPGIVFFAATGAIYVDALGDIFRLYGQFWWYDQVAHFVGGMAVAGILFYFFRALFSALETALNSFWLSFLTLTTTSFLGTLYELEEYFEDYFYGVHRRLGDGPDTASDLFLNIVGALVVLIVIRAGCGRRRHDIKKEILQGREKDAYPSTPE